jgi:hypothetical protein
MAKGYAHDMGEVFAPFGDDDWRECVEGDLAQIGAEEAVRQFRQAEYILEGFMHAANEVSDPLYVCVSSAHTLAREAREAAEGYVRKLPA